MILILSLVFFVSCGSNDEEEPASDVPQTDDSEPVNDGDKAEADTEQPQNDGEQTDPDTEVNDDSEPVEPTDPTEPTEPTEPTDPTNIDPGDCTVISIGVMHLEGSADSYAYYIGTYLPNTGSATADEIDFEIYSETTAQVYDLSEGHNASYSSCAQCIILYEDIVYDNEGYFEGAGKYFFQQSGTMTVNSFSYDSGSLNVTLENVKLIQGVRKYEDGGFSFEPDENGACIVIQNTTINI